MRFHSAMATLEPQKYVLAITVWTKNILLVSRRLVIKSDRILRYKFTERIFGTYTKFITKEFCMKYQNSFGKFLKSKESTNVYNTRRKHKGLIPTKYRTMRKRHDAVH